MSLPLVLLHGWGLTPRVWDPLRAHLPPDRIVHAPTLPGHGEAAPAACDLRAWSDALLSKLPERCVLCGWSLGAMLAMDLAHRRPERVARLVLIGATPRFVADATWPHGLDAETVAGFMLDFAADAAGTLRRFVALQALGDARRRSVQGGLMDAVATPDGKSTRDFAGGLQLLAEADLRDTAAALPQRTLLLHGAGDALMPLAAARWLQDTLSTAELTVFDDCGHAPHLSRAPDSAALIEAFARD